MNPRLSVVLAHRDRNVELARTLHYWRRQQGFDEQSLEILVADDGSREPPVDLCRQWAARLVPVPPDPARKGPSVAWNFGLAEARGDVQACSHAEIIPDLNVGRYLYGLCTGDAAMLEDLDVWIPGPMGKWDHGVDERPVADPDIRRMGDHAVRANCTTFRLKQEHAARLDGAYDPGAFQQDPEFWHYRTDFGGHTNHEIRHRFRGFFWNNCFSMRAELWSWINRLRPSGDWGVDDSDMQERNVFLKITYAFTDSTFAYHQEHDPGCRSGITDNYMFTSLEDARLLFLYPHTASECLNLRREPFWD